MNQQPRVRFSDGEIVKAKPEQINEIRPLVAAVRFALYRQWPGEAFIRTGR